MKKILRIITIAISVLAIAYLALEFFVFGDNIIVPLIITVSYIGLLIAENIISKTMQTKASKAIEESIDASVAETLKEGSIGIIVYNENYEITWMSPFFINKGIDKTNEKVLSWLPELQDLLQGNAERQVVTIEEGKYSVSKKDDSPYLMFKDITNEYNLKKKISEDAYVLGLINYDNYDEYREDDDDLAFINSNIKVPVIDYFKKFNVVYKTLRSAKMMLILNEKSYKGLVDDKFSILNTVRNESKKGDIDITLSIAFARGSENLDELDDEAQELLELAQTRGGDQVVSRKLGEDVEYFGGSTEAKEKRSRVKIRVIVNSLKDLINKSSNVIIVGHKDMDADCVGSALCMSNIVSSLNKDAYIVYKSGGVEPMISDVMSKYSELMSSKHKFISETDALNIVNDKTLFVMVDHHVASQSNGEELLKRNNNLVIIDHHRRKANLDVNPTMIYIEAGASSTCELMSEFLAYMPKKLDIKDEEANIMYLGLLIDTDRFRVRTGTRTFDAAKTLRDLGADPAKCDELAEEPYELFNKRTMIINGAKRYNNEIVIAAMNDNTYNRTVASQACDALIKVKEIEAAFVIVNSEKGEVVLSARSNGNINVQVIVEKMNGGGHMTAAGLQRKETTVSKVANELIGVLNSFYKGEQNESNINS